MLWFHCDATTGAIVTAGMAPTQADAELNHPLSGQVLCVVPDGTVMNPFSPTPDFSILKEYLRKEVDVAVGALRGRYISDVPGQAQTYEKKEREAREWTMGADPSLFPFMSTEATVRGISIEQVRSEIMAEVVVLTPLAALAEAHRVATKQAILAADTLPAIMNAAMVDWNALFASLGA